MFRTANVTVLYRKALLKNPINIKKGACLRQSTLSRSRHLLSISDLTPEQLRNLVQSASRFKHAVKNGTLDARVQTALQGQTIAMVFNKRSTRTRISTEGAVNWFGGHPMFLGKDDIQLGVNESLRDTATVLSSMTSAIFARVGSHSDIDELARYSTVPIINALSDTAHPLQTIADLLTMHEEMMERSSSIDKSEDPFSKAGNNSLDLSGLKVAWVGDANNVLYDLAIAAAKLGVIISVAAPKGYGLPTEVIKSIQVAAASAGQNSHKLLEFTSPADAIQDANFILTDTWVSMGQEEEKAKRLKAFAGYQISNELIKKGTPKNNWRFMHCLPRHAEEVDDEIFYGPHSLVFREAENRLYAAMAALEAFIMRDRVS